MDTVGVKLEKLRLALDTLISARDDYLIAIQAAKQESEELSVLLNEIIQQPHTILVDCGLDG